MKNKFVDTYRPTTFKNIILSKSLRKDIQNIIKNKSFNNLIFYGTAGNGKTTTARVICEELNCDLYEVNASIKGIDALRKEITNFATTVSLEGKSKVVLLDEADNMSKAFQQALRGTIESVSKNCTFILTANYYDRILPAIQSRCTSYDFSISEDDNEIAQQTIKACEGILRKEKIKFSKNDVNLLVSKFFPDIRACINNLDTASKSGTLTLSSAQVPQYTGTNISITVDTGKILFKRPESINWHSKILIPGTRRYVKRSLKTTDKKLAMKRLEEEFKRVTGTMDRAVALALIETMSNELDSLRQYVKNMS